MAEIGRWYGHVFEVSPQVIMGFTGLQIKSSIATKDRDSNYQEYIAYDNAKATEISLTIHLNAALGVDVRGEAELFLKEAQLGSQDYFYVGEWKLMPCKVMLTEATVKEIGIAHDGTWTSANVSLSLKQSSVRDKEDGTSAAASSGGGGSGSSSSKKKTSSYSSSTKSSSSSSSSSSNLFDKVSSAVSGTVSSAKNLASSIASVLSTVSGASSAKKTSTSTTSKSTSSTSGKAGVLSSVSKIIPGKK